MQSTRWSDLSLKFGALFFSSWLHSFLRPLCRKKLVSRGFSNICGSSLDEQTVLSCHTMQCTFSKWEKIVFIRKLYIHPHFYKAWRVNFDFLDRKMHVNPRYNNTNILTGHINMHSFQILHRKWSLGSSAIVSYLSGLANSLRERQLIYERSCNRSG